MGKKKSNDVEVEAEVNEAEVNEVDADAGEGKVTKSIVPSKYAGKYKGGGSDELATFINGQCTGKDGFEFTAFFALARKNEVPEEKVAHYESMVEQKAHGGEGRARMTIRNMLAPKARKNGHLIGLDGEEHPIKMPVLKASGAAAKAKADKAEAEAEAEV